jgi:hypothetical protein
MLSPTTLTFSVLVLVLGDRPLRTGPLVLPRVRSARRSGSAWWRRSCSADAAASRTPSEPKTWVAVLDVVAGVVLLALVVRVLRRPANSGTHGMIEQIAKVASSPSWRSSARRARSPTRARFIPIALKDISELDPTATQYIVDWVFFSLVSLLPSQRRSCCCSSRRDWTNALARSVRWLDAHARNVARVIVVPAALSLLANGIAGLTA